MREYKTFRSIPTEVSVYVAIDGREFDVKEECQDYECELLKLLDGYGKLIEVLHDKLGMTYQQIAKLSGVSYDNLTALGF